MGEFTRGRAISRVGRFVDLWMERPWIDWVFGGALAVAAVKAHMWTYVTVPDRGELYGAMSGVSLGLLGLGTVAVTIVVSVTPTVQLRKALSEAGRDLVDLMFRALRALIVATFLCVLVFGFDGHGQAAIRTALVVFSVVLMIANGARLLRLLHLVLRLLL